MGRKFLPVNRDQPAFLPVNMLDWVPEDHVVRLVIDTVEAVATPELTARLVPPVRTRKGRRRYDPVMLLALLAYSYLRGVLSSRAIEDRCRYDATFRVACGQHVPDHVTIARFRKLACSRDGLMEELFYAVLAACAAAGLGRLTVVAGDGVKIGANASKEANRTEAGLAKLAAGIVADAAAAEAAEAAGDAPAAGADLLGGEVLPAGWADPRSRAARVRVCLDDLKGRREAAEAAARAAGEAYLDALAAGTATGRPPADVAVAAQQIRVDKAIAAQEALIGDWQARRAGAGSRLGSLSNSLCKLGQLLSFCYITAGSFRRPGQTGTRLGNATANEFMAAFQPRVPVPRFPLSRTSPSPSMWRPVIFLIPR